MITPEKILQKEAAKAEEAKTERVVDIVSFQKNIMSHFDAR